MGRFFRTRNFFYNKPQYFTMVGTLIKWKSLYKSFFKFFHIYILYQPLIAVKNRLESLWITKPTPSLLSFLFV